MGPFEISLGREQLFRKFFQFSGIFG